MQAGAHGGGGGVITGRVGRRVGPLLDPSSRQQVDATLMGSFSVSSAQPRDPNEVIAIVQRSIVGAARSVLANKLGAGQIAVPTISHSMPALTPEIVQTAQLSGMGIQVHDMQLAVQVQGGPATGPAPHAGPMPPDPMTAAANAYQQALAEELDPRNKEYEVRVNVGGFKLKASTDEGFDSAGLTGQIKDKAKSTLIWWAAGCMVMGVVGLGVLIAAYYVYSQVMVTASGGVASTSKNVQAASWDGTKPFTCGAGQNLRIANVSANLSEGTAITAASTCKLELSGVDIRAPLPLSALGDAQVTVNGGSLKGTQYAVKALGNAKVTLQGTTIEGAKGALGNASITGP